MPIVKTCFTQTIVTLMLGLQNKESVVVRDAHDPFDAIVNKYLMRVEDGEWESLSIENMPNLFLMLTIFHLYKACLSIQVSALLQLLLWFWTIRSGIYATVLIRKEASNPVPDHPRLLLMRLSLLWMSLWTLS